MHLDTSVCDEVQQRNAEQQLSAALLVESQQPQGTINPEMSSYSQQIQDLKADGCARGCRL